VGAVAILGALSLWTLFAGRLGHPVHDDAIYGEAAFAFAITGEVLTPDLAGPTAALEASLGGIAVRAFGSDYGVLRATSFLLLIASAPALFWTIRHLGGSMIPAVAGATAYGLNPMLFSISNTFMTDGHAVALR
jgi:4-amino-4-deoxy-L-arabinose transferase-like glycosyltransferase